MNTQSIGRYSRHFDTLDAGLLHDIDQVLDANQDPANPTPGYILQYQTAQLYDGALLANRPTYPTTTHLSAITKVAELVHHNTPYRDDHGRATRDDQAAGRVLPGTVHYSSEKQQLNLYAMGPYSANGIGRLWSFTEDEVAAYARAIEQHDLVILEEWLRGDRLSFIVVSESAP